MGYASNKVFLIYKKTDHTCNGHRFHYAWFYEYIYFIYTEDNNTLIYLLIQQYPESIINNLDMINLVPCELDLTPIPFWDSSMITYVIELPPDGKQTGFNLLDVKYFTISYIIDTIPNLPYWNKFQTQAKNNVWIIDTNEEETIT